MLLKLSLFILVPTLCSTHPSHLDPYPTPDISKVDQRSHHHPWDFKFEYLKAKNTLNHISLKSLASNNHKRHALSIDAAPPFDATSPTSINPWDDAGRSQMLDNEPSTQLWRTCPRFALNCRKCPLDARCRRRPRPSFPWWRPVDVLDVPDALRGPVIAGQDGVAREDAEAEKQCGLRTCQNGDCGEGARCVRGHCVCHVGLRGDGGKGTVVRGFDGLQALTVWVDRGMTCKIPCESLSCAEVEQVKACLNKGGEAEDGHGELKYDQLETFDVGRRGAVNVPSAVVRKEEGKDYVGGIANPAILGEDN